MIAIIKSCFELKIVRETAIIYLLTNTICIKTSQPLYEHIQELTLYFFLIEREPLPNFRYLLVFCVFSLNIFDRWLFYEAPYPLSFLE